MFSQEIFPKKKKKKVGVIIRVIQSHAVIINIQCSAWDAININGQIFPKAITQYCCQVTGWKWFWPAVSSPDPDRALGWIFCCCTCFNMPHPDNSIIISLYQKLVCYSLKYKGAWVSKQNHVVLANRALPLKKKNYIIRMCTMKLVPLLIGYLSLFR